METTNMETKNLIDRIIGIKKDIDNSSSYISIWSSWYAGKVRSFHSYYIYNGTSKNRLTKKSLQMAKKVSEDWASLLMNEKVQIGVGGKNTNDKMQRILSDLRFQNKTNKAVEYGFALSYSVVAISVRDLVVNDEGEITDKTNANILYNVFSARNAVPITYEDNILTECALISKTTDETIYEIHHKNEKGVYIISVCKVDKNGVVGDVIDFNTMSNIPWFTTIEPNIVNNIDLDSPAPISIYANALDNLKAIDNAYDSYDNEFTNGRKRIFVSARLFSVDKENGNVNQTFDPHDTVFYQLPEQVFSNGQVQELVKSVSDALRTNEHSQAIQDQLNYLSSKVGLGVDYYRFEKGRVMTATQVISEKSDTFRNMKKHEQILEIALKQIIKAIIYALKTFTDIAIEFDETKDEISIRFDDSIIEDKATEKANDEKDVANGIMSAIDYRMKWYAEDEKTAKEYLDTHFGDSDIIKKATNYEPLLTAGVMTTKMFVRLVYNEDFAKKCGYKSLDEMITDIEESVKKGNSISAEDIIAMGGYNKKLNGEE